jgi:hypothetical protein
MNEDRVPKTFDQIVAEAEQLSPADQMRLIAHLVAHMQVIIPSTSPARCPDIVGYP